MVPAGQVGREIEPDALPLVPATQPSPPAPTRGGFGEVGVLASIPA